MPKRKEGTNFGWLSLSQHFADHSDSIVLVASSLLVGGVFVGLAYWSHKKKHPHHARLHKKGPKVVVSPSDKAGDTGRVNSRRKLTIPESNRLRQLIREHLNQSEGSSKFGSRDAIQVMFQKADRNEDGQITRDEFKQYATALVKDFARAKGGQVADVFKGTLELGELDVVINAKFDEYDLDRSDTLDAVEFRAWAENFLAQVIPDAIIPSSTSPKSREEETKI
jgi:Ca2+-binding EF-hand superfamily protein